MSEEKLPKGWDSLPLEKISDFVIGGDWGVDLESDTTEDFIPVACIRGSEIKNWRVDKGRTASIRKIKQNSLEKRQLRLGDLLIEISGGGPDQPVGRVILIDEDALAHNPGLPKIGTNFLRLIRLIDIVNSSFVNYYLQKFYISGKIVEYQGGSNNLRNLKYKEFSKIEIPLPPLSEQQRIVARLDAIFGHLDVLREKLDRIPKLLKSFRQQVLTQAVTGELTREWRVGKDLGEWEYIDLQEIADVVDPHPSHRTPPSEVDGVPYISIKDVDSNGKIDFQNATLVSSKILEEHVRRYALKEGDLGFGKIGTLGKPFRLPIFKGRTYTLSANIILIQPKSNCNPKFLFYYLDSPIINKLLKEGAKATSQPAFGIKKARVFPTPNPSMEEQEEIVKRVDALFGLADIIESQYQILKTKIDQLPQAVLAKAFRGELVGQEVREYVREVGELGMVAEGGVERAEYGKG